MSEDVPVPAATNSEVQRTVEAVWHMESARIVAKLVRVLRDVGHAEDVAQDALVAALEHWPRTGIPANPAAWIMATAKNRAIDALRQAKLAERKAIMIATDPDLLGDGGLALERRFDEDIPDDQLRLMFVACHPVLSTEARVALTLRLLGGLTTEEIARAFLVSEAAIQQRIVRAKRTLSEARVPFELPRDEERTARLASVLEVIYLIFNEGYVATSGEHWLRPTLCEEGLRLGRVLAALAPHESEVHGLVALMEIQASRNAARVGPGGEPILLMDQDRSRWDQLLISRGLTALARVEALATPLGPYALQAAIAACHARAKQPDDTDWARIVALYDALAALAPSPIVALNRAVAVSRAYGPDAGLAIVETLKDDKRLTQYHLLPSVRADLLEKLGRLQEAHAEFMRAAALARNARERTLLLARAAGCEHDGQSLN
jgi:RNA polymerase sigma-70 factor, ECF subfamily